MNKRFKDRVEYLLAKSANNGQDLSMSINDIMTIIDKDVTLRDIYKIAEVLNIPAYTLFLDNNNFFERLNITLEELQEVSLENPSLGGTINGYLGEIKLREYLANDSRITILPKPDDHDRSAKYDLPIEYKGRIFKIESKSLQTNSIKRSKKRTDIIYEATLQCDASDCRPIVLPNGKTVTTTCLQYGDFDILAVNMFKFNQQWEFAFALNCELPQSGKGSKKNPIPEDCQKYLMKTSIPITYPIEGIFVSDICILLDKIIETRG